MPLKRKQILIQDDDFLRHVTATCLEEGKWQLIMTTEYGDNFLGPIVESETSAEKAAEVWFDLVAPNVKRKKRSIYEDRGLRFIG